MNEELLTPGEVASRLKVTEQTVCNWLRTGQLQGVRAGRLWRVRESVLAGFLKAGRKGGSTPGGVPFRRYSRSDIRRFIEADQIDPDTAAKVREILGG